MPVALAERRNGFGGDLLFAFEADAGAFGEAEDVFGFDLIECVRRFVLRSRRQATHAEQSEDDKSDADHPPRHTHPHTPIRC
jgi:hypothetical protein